MAGSSVGVKSSDVFGTFSSSPACGSTLLESIPLNPLGDLIFVRYRDHVLYNRSSALAMQPQIREAVGWLVYECELYVILSWDRDAAADKNLPVVAKWRKGLAGLLLSRPL